VLGAGELQVLAQRLEQRLVRIRASSSVLYASTSTSAGSPFTVSASLTFAPDSIVVSLM